jgi:hypothetical protein
MYELGRSFGTEEQCERKLIELRWPGGFECPHCGGNEYRKIGTRREYYCTSCCWQFSATSGTLLAHTKVPLTSWFRAAFMLVNDARGVSAQRVAEECCVSDVAGGKMLARLRNAMGFSMAICKVGGDYVEVDQAHVACGNTKDSGVNHPGKGTTQAPVMVAVSADRCVMRVASDSTKGTTEAFAAAHVSRNHEVRADASRSNGALAGGWDARLRRSARDGDSEDSMPAVHHVIANFKALLLGTHHGVTVEHLQTYCDQFSWRYSHRKGDAVLDLLGDLVRWPHVDLDVIGDCRTAMPKHKSKPEPGAARNSALRSAWRADQEERKGPLLQDLASLLTAAQKDKEEREWWDDWYAKHPNDYRETAWEFAYFDRLSCA